LHTIAISIATGDAEIKWSSSGRTDTYICKQHSMPQQLYVRGVYIQSDDVKLYSSYEVGNY